jgi:hypothetical protein
MMTENNWGIRAVFEHNSLFLPHKYTYFDEVTYATEKEALEAINGDRGEELSQASTIDCKTEDDLKDHYLCDLEPYQLSMSWSELAELTHRTQVERFNFCLCEDGDKTYSDCPDKQVSA